MTDEATIRPTQERMNKGGVIVAARDRFGKEKPWTAIESAHDLLLAEGLISIDAWHAGNKFLSTYQAAFGNGMVTQQFRVRVNSSHREPDVTKSQQKAITDINEWSAKIAPSLFDCLKNVLVFGVAPSRYARDLSKHPTSGRELLAVALEQMAHVA